MSAGHPSSYAGLPAAALSLWSTPLPSCTPGCPDRFWDHYSQEAADHCGKYLTSSPWNTFPFLCTKYPESLQQTNGVGRGLRRGPQPGACPMGQHTDLLPGHGGSRTLQMHRGMGFHTLLSAGPGSRSCQSFIRTPPRGALAPKPMPAAGRGSPSALAASSSPWDLPGEGGWRWRSLPFCSANAQDGFEG